MNSRNNLAYDHSYETEYPSYQPKTQSNIRIKTSKSEETASRKRANTAGFVKLLLLATFAFVVLLRGVMITEKATDINQKSNDYQALMTANEKLRFEIDRSLDLNNVENIARNELGMRRAEKYQTVYINIEQTDYVEKVAKNNFNPVDHIVQAANYLLAYSD